MLRHLCYIYIYYILCLEDVFSKCCSLFYFSLAVADSLLIIELVVEKTVMYHYQLIYGTEPQWYTQSYPYFWHPIKGIFMSATIFMVVAVSADRFRAICYPLTKKHVRFHTFYLNIEVGIANK